MTVSTVAERLTAVDYLARDDRRRTELIDGVVVANEPTVLHQRVVGLIHAALLAWTRSAPGRGTVSLPLDVRVDDATVLAPDVLWFAQEIDLGAPRMPELAVEVRSPATWVYVGPKRELYERHGLRELWLADTASRTLLVYRRSGANGGFDVQAELEPREQLASSLLPGFAATVGRADPRAQLATSIRTARTARRPGLERQPRTAARTPSTAETRVTATAPGGRAAPQAGARRRGFETLGP